MIVLSDNEKSNSNPTDQGVRIYIRLIIIYLAHEILRTPFNAMFSVFFKVPFLFINHVVPKTNG